MDRPAILEFPRQTQMSREKIASRRPSRNLERKFYRGFARLADRPNPDFTGFDASKYHPSPRFRSLYIRI